MKKYLFACLFLVSVIGKPNDSLQAVIDTTQNLEKKVKALNSLAWSYRSTDLRKADSLSNIAIDLAKQNDFETEYANALNTLGVLDLMQGRMEEGVEKLEECAEINLRNKVYKAYLDNRMNIGLTFYFKGELDTSATIMWDLYHLADSLDELAINKQLLHNLSSIYNAQGKYVEALEVAFKSLDNAKKQGDESEVSKTYNSIGLIYDYLGNLEKAKYYHRRSFSINQENNDIDGLSSNYGNLGEIYRQNEAWDSAYYCYKKAFYYAKQMGDSSSIAGQMMNLAIYYEQINEFDSAKVLIKRALGISKRNDFGYQITLGDNMMGFNYLNRDQAKKAIPFLRSSLEQSTAYGIPDVIQANYDGLYQAYLSLNKTDSAIKYLEKWIHLKDSLTNLKAQEKIDWLETEYRTAEKEKEIAQLNNLKTKNELEISQQRNWIIILISGLFGAFLITMVVVQRNKRKSQAEKDAAIIKERDKRTEAVFSAQEEERKRISKDLHDGVGQQLSGLKMAFQKLSSDLKTSNPEKETELEKLTTILHESADEVRSISHQMMPKALTELGIIEAIDDMLEKSLGSSSISYEFEHFGIDNRLDEKIEVSLYRITQELINNIIKHSEAKKVAVQLFKNKGKVILIVEDNGKGIQKSQVSDGHGLLNIKSRLNSIHGEVNYEPSPQSGTTATVRIPIA
ncbi:MAG: tetratricopeptide repeat protein [Vicingaceae bacterium]